MEYVPYKSMEFIEEVKSYYERCGSILAVALLLGFHDGHRENLISSGAFPKLVDVETFFEPSVSPLLGTDQKESMSRVKQMLLSTSLIQEVPIAFDPFFGDYMAAFQQSCSSRVSKEDVIIIDDKTTFMRVDYSETERQLSPPSQAKLGEEVMTIDNYLPHFLDGFQETLDRIENKKTDLCRLLKVTEESKLKCRVILRHTSHYQRLLWQLMQPMLQDEKRSSDMLLRELSNDREHGGKLFMSPNKKTYIEAEVNALLNLDVPIFYTWMGSSFLLSESNSVLDEFEAHSPMDGLQYCLALSVRKHAHRCVSEILQYPINTTPFRVLFPSSYANIVRQLVDKLVCELQRNSTYFMQSKEKFGDNICDELSTTCRLNLHDGLAGATLLLCCVCICFPGETYGNFTRQLCGALFEEFQQRNPKCTNVGGSVGLGSVVYVLSFAALTFKASELVQSAYECSLALTEMLIERDKHFDIINGVAGATLSLLALIEVDDTIRALSLVQRKDVVRRLRLCGDMLISNGINPRGGFLFWNSSHLSGFSHGCAGIAFSLFKLGLYCKDTTYLKAAGRAWQFEDTLIAEK